MNSFATNGPRVFVSGAELAEIKANYSSGKQPWKNAGDKIINTANSALSKQLLSVGSNGNDQCDRCFDDADYSNAIQVRNNSVALALAYHLTGDSKYADKSAAMVRAFLSDPNQGMVPDRYPSPSKNGQIRVSITVPGMIYAADLTWDSNSSWDSTQKKTICKLG